MSFNIIIPGGPVGFQCRICGTPFKATEETAFARHNLKCYRENEAELRAQSHAEVSPDLFGPESGDHEKRRWAKQHKPALVRGDMKL